MSGAHDEEIAANLERAEESVVAARELAGSGHQDFAASRAYYAAFYAATAALLSLGLESGKHSGVIAAFHQHLVKTGKVDVRFGKDLNWLSELRGVGDYGETRHVPKEEAEKAIQKAQALLQALKAVLGR